MASQDKQENAVQLTCPVCDITVTQAPGTKRTICPHCGNFYDAQAASQRVSDRPVPQDEDERLPHLPKDNVSIYYYIKINISILINSKIMSLY